MPKRIHKTGWTVLAVMIVLIIVCALLARFVFVVRNVELEGDSGPYSREDVVRLASVGLGESIFQVDADRIESRVNATGKLKVNDVRLRYPDTVRISVEQRSRDAMVLHMGKIRVLDREGYVVESLDQVPNEDIIYVSGMRVQGYALGEIIRADEKQLAAYQAVISSIRSQSASLYVSELDLSDPQNMRVISRNGITVELGDMQNMQDKIAWMKGAVADLERRGEAGGTLDVRSGTKADYRAPVAADPSD